MQSIGEKLKEARLKKQLSLTEVYRQTKIHPSVLEALEQDQAHSFLSPLYIKGFLRKYAHFLGLDAETILKEYIDSQKAEVSPGPVSLEVKARTSATIKVKPFLIARVAAALILSFTLIFYYRFLIRRTSQPPLQAQRQKVKVRVVPASAATKLPVKEDLILEVRTKDICWMRVKIDGQVIFEKALPKGGRERWRAKEIIELKIGKPEVLEVFLNGKLIDLEKEQVKRTLVITREEIQGK